METQKTHNKQEARTSAAAHYYNNVFKKQLAKGKEAEERAHVLIKNIYDVDIIEEQTEKNYKDMHYDFKTSDNKKYEVKRDDMAKQTDNIFIEFSAFGKDSGIKTTEANKYIIVVGDTFYIISVVKLLKLCLGSPIKEIEATNTKGHIIKLEKLKEHADIYEA